MIIKKYFNAIKSLINNRRGFALLELIITLTLLGILLAMGFMFYSFGVVSYNIGEEQTDIQQNARLAADFIISELRVAEAVTIVEGYEHLDIDDFGMTHADETPVFYIYVKDNAIYYQEHEDLAAGEMPGDGTSLTAILENISTNIDFELSFAKSTTEDKDNILEFDLSAKSINSDREYVLDTQLLVLNLDEIEEFNLTGDSGTALAYQVPAPEHPLIRRVTIAGRDYHHWENTTDDVNIDIYVETLNVEDGKSVKIEFLRIGEHGVREEVGEVTEQSSVMVGDEARLYDADDKSLKVPNNLAPFGDYYVRATVDCQYTGTETCDGSCEGLHLTQGRFYYIHPKIWDLQVDETRGSPFLCAGSLKTGGVPEGTGIILGTEAMIDDVDIDDIILLIYDRDAQEYVDPNMFYFHSIHKVDGDGKLSYVLRFNTSEDYEAYLDTPITMEYYIGGISASVDFRTLEGEIFYLSGLEVEVTDLNQIADMEPPFDSETNYYDVNIPYNEVRIGITAQHGHLDEYNASTVHLVKIKRDGSIIHELYEDNADFTIVLEELEITTTVEVELINEDNEVLNTYTIVVDRSDE